MQFGPAEKRGGGCTTTKKSFFHYFELIYNLSSSYPAPPPLLTRTTDGFNVVGLQGFMEDHDAPQLALQGGRTPPLAVLGSGGNELGHGLGLPPQQPPPGLRGQDATQRGASGGRRGRGEGGIWDLRGRGSGGPVARRADAAGGKRLWVEITVVRSLPEELNDITNSFH